MDTAVIIPAAGSGRRFGTIPGKGGSKIELDLAGRPVFLRSIECFLGRDDVRQIILAVNPREVDDFKFRYGDRLGLNGVKLVAGGTKERWETVLLAIEAVDAACTHVAIHDAVRPLASRQMIDRVFDAATKHRAVIPGLPVSNSLKRVVAADAREEEADPLAAILGDAGKPQYTLKRIVEGVDRADLVEVQTPQVFEIGLIRAAYEAVGDGQVDTDTITDDAGLVQAMGEEVFVVEGESTNLKITRQGDYTLAQAYAARRDAASKKELAKKKLFGDED
jgi:2-C-methyl-D-erythritol 4-phosphate cytidylyltransferase